MISTSPKKSIKFHRVSNKKNGNFHNLHEQDMVILSLLGGLGEEQVAIETIFLCYRLMDRKTWN